ncbi:MAG: hypothetical protein EAS52_05845 [Parapedobacter sp.]|nr:MAG: hypothetical protein EAS52_05845 [Parapedobacter sp.]
MENCGIYVNLRHLSDLRDMPFLRLQLEFERVTDALTKQIPLTPQALIDADGAVIFHIVYRNQVIGLIDGLFPE